MALESLYSVDRTAVYREVFNSAYDLARNSLKITNVTVANGLGTFNGNNSNINIDPKLLSNKFRFTLRFNLRNVTGSDVRYFMLGAKTGDAFQAYLTSTNKILLDIDGLTGGSGVRINFTSDNSINTAKQDVFVVYDSSGATAADRLKLYFNETLQTGTYGLTGGGVLPVYTGLTLGLTSSSYQGDMSLVSFYNRALAVDEVSALCTNKLYKDARFGVKGEWFLKGTLVDNSGNEKDGTSIGSVVFRGNQGLTRRFDGVNDYVELPSFLEVFRDSFSLSFWIKPREGQPSSTQYFYGARYNSSVPSNSRNLAYLATNGKITFQYETEDNLVSFSSDVAVFSNGRVHDFKHIMIVVNNITKTICLFIDGVEQVNTGNLIGIDMAAYSDTVAKSPYVGSHNFEGAPSTFFKGDVSLTRIYDRAVTDEEVVRVYNSLKNTFSK